MSSWREMLAANQAENTEHFLNSKLCAFKTCQLELFNGRIGPYKSLWLRVRQRLKHPGACSAVQTAASARAGGLLLEVGSAGGKARVWPDGFVQCTDCDVDSKVGSEPTRSLTPEWSIRCVNNYSWLLNTRTRTAGPTIMNFSKTIYS